MRTITLLGLSGYAQSGKDTAAAELARYGWHRHAFADKLRECAYALNPIILTLPNGMVLRLQQIVDSTGWESAKEVYPEVRRTLQRLGTEAGRDILGQDVWVDAAMAEVPPYQHAVFTDMRFPNEAARIRDEGGILIRITRPGVGPATAPDGTVHLSEVALDGWEFDVSLVNDGTPADLGGRLARAVRDLEVSPRH